MAYVAVDKNGQEVITESKPFREVTIWQTDDGTNNSVDLPKGSIEKLIGKKLTWEDEPVELKEEL